MQKRVFLSFARYNLGLPPAPFLPPPVSSHHHHLLAPPSSPLLPNSFTSSAPSLADIPPPRSSPAVHDTPCMDPALATHPIPHGHPSASFQHHYGTRIRQNSVIKPSARLRQPADSPAPPRRIRPALPVPKPGQPSLAPPPDSGILDFPPPHVMLHVEDSSSKVFLAIGRSFLSVVAAYPIPVSVMCSI